MFLAEDGVDDVDETLYQVSRCLPIQTGGKLTLREFDSSTHHECEDVVCDTVGIGAEREQARCDSVAGLLLATGEQALYSVDNPSHRELSRGLSILQVREGGRTYAIVTASVDGGMDEML